jgi:hypothetical protein
MSRLIVLVLSAISLIGMGMPQVDAAPLPIASVTASDAQIPNVPENTIDGDLGTRWAAQGEGQWIEYELELCDTVALVKIAWYKGDSRVAWFDIMVSNDRSIWRNIHYGESSGTTLELQTVDIDDTPACFVMIIPYGNSRNDWNSITEVQIEGTSAVRLDPPGLLPVFAVSASDFQEPNVAANTLDADLNTRWAAKGIGQWIEFDLGPDWPKVDQVSIAWYHGNQNSWTFDIEVWDEEWGWILIYGGHSSGTTLELQHYRFYREWARYIRIVGHGNSKNDWISFAEIQFVYDQFRYPE